MMQLRQRAQKIARVRSFEISKLNVLVAEMAVIQARITELEERQAKIVSEIEDLSAVSGQCTVDELQSSLRWRHQLRQQCLEVLLQIKAFQEKRNLMNQQLTQQRTTIKGWEKLQSKIEAELNEHLRNQEAAEADDTYLNSRSGTAANNKYDPA